MSLYNRYRPKRLRDVLGQEAAIKSIEKLLEKDDVPHAIMLTGPSGTGKTTIARILKSQLKCSDHDFLERNCADFRGVDDVREMRRHCGFAPLGGQCRIWLIDECQKLTSDAQDALLKLLEDTPEHTYFILATTDPSKLRRTIHTRCSQIKLVGLQPETISKLLGQVIEKEGMEVSEEAIKEICDAAEGSARKALVILEQVAPLETSEEQIAAIQTSTFNKDEAIDLARELMFPQDGWTKVCKLLRNLAEQDAEGIRYCVLGYARACLVGSKDGKPPNPKFAGRAFMVIEIFSRNFYDSKNAGLAAACYETMHPK